MSTSTAKARPVAKSVRVTAHDLIVELADGRTISVPLTWFPRLAHAAREQLLNYELLADGEGIRWPELDEDLSVAGLLRGSGPGAAGDRPSHRR
jgi:hypothetical protein